MCTPGRRQACAAPSHGPGAPWASGPYRAPGPGPWAACHGWGGRRLERRLSARTLQRTSVSCPGRRLPFGPGGRDPAPRGPPRLVRRQRHRHGPVVGAAARRQARVFCSAVAPRPAGRSPHASRTRGPWRGAGRGAVLRLGFPVCGMTGSRAEGGRNRGPCLPPTDGRPRQGRVGSARPRGWPPRPLAGLPRPARRAADRGPLQAGLSHAKATGQEGRNAEPGIQRADPVGPWPPLCSSGRWGWHPGPHGVQAAQTKAQGPPPSPAAPLWPASPLSEETVPTPDLSLSPIRTCLARAQDGPHSRAPSTRPGPGREAPWARGRPRSARL